MNPSSSYTRRIQEVYPHLHIQDVEMNSMGQNNDVLIVNQTLVFRFPKYAESLQAMIRETQLLNRIKSKVTRLYRIRCMFHLTICRWVKCSWAIR